MASENEKWAWMNCETVYRLALNAVSEVARLTAIETQTKIPLKTSMGEAREILLADLVVKRLKKDGFKVFRSNQGEVREYCVAWGRNDPKIPDGFDLI